MSTGFRGRKNSFYRLSRKLRDMEISLDSEVVHYLIQICFLTESPINKSITRRMQKSFKTIKRMQESFFANFSAIREIEYVLREKREQS